MAYQLKERTFVNADQTRVVPETSPEAAYLLGPRGYVIPDALAERLGLKEHKHVETKELKHAEMKASQEHEEQDSPDAYNRDTQLERALTVLTNNNVDLEHLPTMPDAQILEIDGIGPGLLATIRAHFPHTSQLDDADDDLADGQ